MKKLSVTYPKRKVSFDHNEYPQSSPPPTRSARVSFDHNENNDASSPPPPRAHKQSFVSHNSYKTMSPKSRHGFFSEFEIVKPAHLESTYSLRSLKPGPNESYKDKLKCRLSTIIPMLRWLPFYSLTWFKADFIAAITVAILQVPQVLAYATLAGLPPEWGLYASVVPVSLYAIWSTSTKVAVGPGAPSAIMLASAVSGVIASYGISSEDAEYEELYQSLAMTFTFCCGVVFIILGIMRAGFVVVFLSRPVMTGFILSASLIIVLSQCRSLFGLDIGRYPIFYINLIAVINNIHTIHWWTTLISAVSLVILFLPKYVKGIPRWVPLPLIVMVGNILMSYFLDFESLGVDVVGGEVKSGLPIPKLPNMKYIPDIFPSALVVTIVDYMSNIVLANSFEQKTKDVYQQEMGKYNDYIRQQQESVHTNTDKHGNDNDDDKDEQDEKEEDVPLKPLRLAPIDVDANMEFMAYGIANLFGSFCSSQLISASFSRTALNYEMNAQTRVAGLIRVVICILCLLFLMPFLSPLPKCVLASVVITAVYRLIKDGITEMIFLWKVSKFELVEFFVCVMAPLFIGMEMGIFLAIGTSIIVNLLRHTFASVIFLGQLKTNNNNADVEYVDAALFKQARYVPHITIIEIKSELSFSNNLRLVNKIRELLADNNRYIVVSLNLTSFIDTTAIRQIVTLFEDARGSYICLSQCRPKVVELIRRYQRSAAKFPPNVKTFISTHDAVRYLQKIRRKQSDFDDLDDIEDDLSSIKLCEVKNDDNGNDMDMRNIETIPLSPAPPPIGETLDIETINALEIEDNDNDQKLPQNARI